jgi:formylglycine-generating enzyme required for sulfatase activity
MKLVDRVLRGGSYSSGPWILRSSNRDWDIPVRQIRYIGLRLVVRSQT